MLIQVEINNPHVLAALEQEAAQSHKPLPRVVEEAIEQKFLGPQDRLSASEHFRLIRERLLAQRGGKLFSDSAEDIRDSRENDH